MELTEATGIAERREKVKKQGSTSQIVAVIGRRR
jgi:hypothetical protein